MSIYLLKFSACLLVFWLVYVLFLEKLSVHYFKRIYLLGAFMLSLVIPKLTITHYLEPVIADFETMPATVATDMQFSELSPEELPFWNLETTLWVIYGLGVLLLSIRFALNLFKIYQRISNNEKIQERALIYVLLTEHRIPHSFFKYIFFNKSHFESNKIPNEVILHEETHAKQWHSLDILLIELLQIAFWFHPLIYILKHHIKLNHEFLADQAVLKRGVATKNYQNILLQFSSSASNHQLISTINYSSIKKRFTVMKTQTSKTRIWLSSLLLLPVCAILFYSFAEREYIEKEISDENNNRKDSFLVTVAKNGKALELNCESGCKWSHLVLEPNTNEYIINDYGFSEGKTIETDQFTFAIKANNNGVQLNGLKGTAWLDLAFSLSGNKKQAINQLGMTTFDKKSSNQVDNDLRKRAEENYYKKQFFKIKDNSGKYVKKRFFELDYNNKVKWVYAEDIPYTTIDVTQAHFNDIIASKKYIVKLNGNYIPKDELSKYKASDFITFSYTPISGLAKMNEESVVNLITTEVYDVYVKTMVMHYNDVIEDYEKQIPLLKNDSNKNLKEIVSTFEFLNYNYNRFTPKIIKKYNINPPTPIAKTIIDNVNQSYLNIPILYIDENNNLYLDNKPTSLESIQKDFNNLVKNKKSELLLEANGRRVNNSFVEEIMAAIGDNLLNISVPNGQTLIFNPDFKTENQKQQNPPTKKQIAEYNAWAKKLNESESKIIKMKDFEKYHAIYKLMTPEQKEGAEDFPEPSSIPPPPPPSDPKSPNSKRKTLKQIIKETPQNIESGYVMLKNGETHFYRIIRGTKIYYNKNGYQTDNKGNVLPPPPPPPQKPEENLPTKPKKSKNKVNDLVETFGYTSGDKNILENYAKAHPESVTKAIVEEEIVEMVEIPADQEGTTELYGKKYKYITKDGFTNYYSSDGKKFNEKEFEKYIELERLDYIKNTKESFLVINGKEVKNPQVQLTKKEFENLELSLSAGRIKNFKIKALGVKSQIIQGNKMPKKILTQLNLSNQEVFSVQIFDIKSDLEVKIAPVILMVSK
ncbi:MAG: M56 family metallopeptidase [Bacteroidota bacterium]